MFFFCELLLWTRVSSYLHAQPHQLHDGPRSWGPPGSMCCLLGCSALLSLSSSRTQHHRSRTQIHLTRTQPPGASLNTDERQCTWWITHLGFFKLKSFQNIKLNWHTDVEGCAAGPHFCHWVKWVTIPQALLAARVRSAHHKKLVLQRTHTWEEKRIKIIHSFTVPTRTGIIGSFIFSLQDRTEKAHSNR